MPDGGSRRSTYTAGEPPPGQRQVLTVANGFTLARLACIPLFVWQLTRARHAGWITAAYILAALGATDWVDGQLARRLHQVSELGKVLDPLADRLLLVVAAVSIIAVGAIPAWVAAIALAREVFVASGFLYVAARGGARMEVTKAGKAATFLLMVALPLFLAGHSNLRWHRAGENLAWVAVLPALVIGWCSAVGYVAKGRRLLREAGRPSVST